jgi:MFS superfamily sulfate permease-like transporter
MIALPEARTSGLWSRKHIANNVLAGVVVGVVALPLAMAFAIASGARPEQGKRAQAIETARKTWIRIGKSCKSTAR